MLALWLRGKGPKRSSAALVRRKPSKRCGVRVLVGSCSKLSKTRLFQSRILARILPSRFPSSFYLKVGFSVQERPLWSYNTSAQTPGGTNSSSFYLKSAPGGCPITAWLPRKLQKWITSELERKDQGRCPPKADGFFRIRTLRTNLLTCRQPGPGGLVGCVPAVRLR